MQDIPTHDEVAHVARVRAALPVTARYVYMNTGTNGPIPTRSHHAMLTKAEQELIEGRILLSAFPDMLATWAAARAAVADLIGGNTSEIALTHSTTEGVNIALMGMSWRPGDEIITAAAEHAGGLYPVYQIHQRFGVTIRMTNIGRPNTDPVAALKAALSPRTRAVVLSHVSWSSGVTLPLRELIDLSHRAGALFICDAAQSCGMLPTNVRDLDVDVYALSGQKWLCGPDGTGALYVRRDRLGDISPPFMGYFTIKSGMSDLTGAYVPAEGSMRYEAVTLNPITAVGFTESLRWLADEVGWPWAFARTARLARLCHERLAAVPGVTVHTPRETMAALVHFIVAGTSSSEVAKRLAAENILVRRIPDNDFVRASIGFYNTEEEIARLAQQVAIIAGGHGTGIDAG